MYLDKLMSINGDELEESPFEKEMFLEGFLLERINHICPPWAEPTGKVVNQIVLGQGRIDIAFELANNEGWALAELKATRLEWVHLKQLVGYLCQRAALLQGVENRLIVDGQQEGALDGADVLGGEGRPNDIRLVGVLVGPDIVPDLAYALMTNTWRNSVDIGNVVAPEGVEIGAVVVKRFRDLASKAGRGWSNYFVFSDRYFPIITPPGRDYSKFSFDNQLTWHGAGRFVYEYVLSYCRNNPTKSVSQLLVDFPGNLQGGVFGVISPTNARPSRYFKQPISVSSSQVWVCNQWGYARGAGNLHRFIQHIKNAHFHANVWRRQPGAVPVTI